MVERMLQFVKLAQKRPEKRDADARRQDFDEIYQEFAAEKAAEQASRCSQCGIPFCQIHCPLHNNIPDWLKLTAQGRLREAYDVSQETNTFPEVCGRICPQDRLCEGNCVIEKDFEAVTIGAVERYITEKAFDNGWVRPIKPRQELTQSIGIIGAGPGGLATADQMRRKGYQVHVYDRYDRVGGLLIYGIPGFKLEKDVIERRTKQLEDSGVVFHLNFNVGEDATMEELREKHDAILIATGVYKTRALKMPGVGLNNIHQALTYLTASNQASLGDTVAGIEDGTLDAKGKNVVVIGGGDTAMDCVRTAVRQGAKSVKCVYRRDRENMPGSVREVAHAEEEGVEFIWLAAPQAFTGNDSVTGVKAIKMRLGAADSSGRRSPEPMSGSEFTLDADLVIKALGFDPENLPKLFDTPGLDVSRWGTVQINFRTMMTSLDGVFAAGDIVRGASLVVWAIRDGRDAADAMHTYLAARQSTDASLAKAS